MGAVAAAENRMIVEDRIARLESDVGEIKDDVKALNARLNESILATTREFGNLRTEMERGRAETEKGFGILRAEFERSRVETQRSLGSLRADMEQNFGSLRTSIESAKLWMLVTGVGSVIMVTLATILGRILKFF